MIDNHKIVNCDCEFTIYHSPLTIKSFDGTTPYPIQPPLAKQSPAPVDLPGALLPGDHGTGRAAGDHRAEGHPPLREEQPAQAGGQRAAPTGVPPENILFMNLEDYRLGGEKI